jgi:DNA polymerase-1
MQRRKQDYAIARKFAYIWDMWGRILHVAAVRSVHEWIVAAALREANNFPYQSGAQGTIKLTMAQVHDDWIEYGMQDVVWPLLQVHDELLYEVRDDLVDEWGHHVSMRFENCVRLDEIPIKAGTASAQNWGDLDK